ncbi:MAG: hypothetical protein U5K27_18515 [Desulfotignum sp.]|nr:hypothetical protein [Desulfotignum sp.]
MYPILVTISLILVFGSSAFMSVSGLLSIFSSSPTVIISMGLGMEIGKILTISHLYRNWKKYALPVRGWYILIISVLTMLTSFEVMGFLSRCYQDATQEQQLIHSKIDALNQEELVIKFQIETIDQTLSGLPETYVSKKINERRESGYTRMQDRLVEIIKEKAELNAKLISDGRNKNPISGIASLFGIMDSDIITIFIPLLVLILEPLLIGLTIAANSAWNNSSQKPEPQKSPLSGKRDLTKELQQLQKDYALTVEQIAEITNRKKLKTCKGWIDESIPTPPRALAELQAWVEKEYPKKPDG